MVRVQICTCLELEIHKIIKEARWKIPDLITLGIKAKKDNPQLIYRINELEAMNSLLVKRLQDHAKKLYEIQLAEDQKLLSKDESIS